MPVSMVAVHEGQMPNLDAWNVKVCRGLGIEWRRRDVRVYTLHLKS